MVTEVEDIEEISLVRIFTIREMVQGKSDQTLIIFRKKL